MFLFSPLFGEDSHFDFYFSNGLKPPTSSEGPLKKGGLEPTKTPWGGLT